MQAGRKFVEASKAKLNSLESRLAGTFKPIAPRSEFVHGLGQRIQTVRPARMVDRLAGLRIFLLVMAGMLSFGLLVVGVRALLVLLEKKMPSRV